MIILFRPNESDKWVKTNCKHNSSNKRENCATINAWSIRLNNVKHVSLFGPPYVYTLSLRHFGRRNKWPVLFRWRAAGAHNARVRRAGRSITPSLWMVKTLRASNLSTEQLAVSHLTPSDVACSIHFTIHADQILHTRHADRHTARCTRPTPRIRVVTLSGWGNGDQRRRLIMSLAAGSC